jgi:hypothetical protein
MLLLDEVVNPSLGVIASRIGEEKNLHGGAESGLIAEDRKIGGTSQIKSL